MGCGTVFQIEGTAYAKFLSLEGIFPSSWSSFTVHQAAFNIQFLQEYAVRACLCVRVCV